MSNPRVVHPRITRYASLPLETLFHDLQTSPQGYSSRQAAQSRERYGQNQYTAHQTDTVLFRIRRAFVNPFSLILTVLAVISFCTDVVFASNYSRNITTCLLIVGMLLLSGIVRFTQELRAKQATDHLFSLIHTTVQTRRDGQWQELPCEELVVGDLVRIQAGERVPADLRLTTAKDLFVSQSVLTGESAVLEKNSAPLPPSGINNLLDYTNIAFSGSTVIGGSGQGIVLAVGKDTVYGDVGATPAKKSGFDRGANSIAQVLIRFMAVLVPLVFLACGLTKDNWGAAFLFALSVAVGLTPEMLPMVINACLAKGSVAMEKKETIVKNINAMQSFGSMDVLCVDKTGTLTGDRIVLEYYLDILGNESSEVLDYAYLNSLYHTGVQNHLDQAIRKAETLPGKQQSFAALAARCPKLDELPFDYERRFASVLVQDGSQYRLIVKGDVQEVCRRCTQVAYRGQYSPMQPGGMKHVHEVVDEMTEDGMKVLAVATKLLPSSQLSADEEQDLTLIGYLVFFDAPKKSAASAIQKLQQLHVSVKVLTGDRCSVAASVCRRLGFCTDNIFTGDQLDALDEDSLLLAAENGTIFAELAPRQKAKILSVLRENGHTVGFLGDGMNDLPAMLEADVGISAEGAAEALQEAADVVLLKKDLNVLEEGVLEGRKVFANMSKYIRITASSNFGNILAIVIASVLLPFFPMTAVQLLLLNLLYDVLCLVLPWDRVDSELYEQPRSWSGQTLGRFMRFFGPISSAFDCMTFAFLYFVLCPAVCGGDFFSLNAAAQQQFISLFQTGWFVESMWTQVMILHLLRTPRLPFLQSRPARPVAVVTVVGVTLFSTLGFTTLGEWIGLRPLPPIYFVFLLGVVALYLLCITIAKTRYVKKYHELI